MQNLNLNISAFIDKINDYVIFIISFIQTTFNNIIAIRNISFSLFDIPNSIGIIIQFALSIFYILIFITILCFSSSIFDIVKQILKYTIYYPIKLISWPIAKIISLFMNKKNNNNSKTQQSILEKLEKELLILRLQNGKLKKTIEKDNKNKYQKRG
uniref:p3 n=1 Tax=Chinaberry witches'-broom phytoplasma TaxID=389343 RepID=F5CUH4_9MOLU|nr:hypothetical protein [Chinaberry witches'-broom phytoplasma]AEC45508.1 p3 [Chinaberry witches'-broom phytoplasma]